MRYKLLFKGGEHGETMIYDDKFHTFLNDKENLTKLFDHMNDGLIITDNYKRIIWVNPAYERITGYTKEELLHKKPNYIASGKTPRAVFDEMWDCMEKEGTWTGRLLNRRKDGEEFWSYLTITHIKKDSPENSFYIAFTRDITNNVRKQEKIKKMAYRDSLTGLPNHNYFTEYASHLLERAKNDEKITALLYLDLDRFKNVNDSMGHFYGDQLLKLIGERLQNTVSEHGLVSRFGGDEYTIIFEPVSSINQLEPLLQDVFEAVSCPIEIGEKNIQLTASIGGSIYPEHGTDVESLVQNANHAMYRAKDDGYNSFSLFKEEFRQEALAKITIESELREALKRGELEVYYQMQVNLHNEKPYGVEALIRWNHPEKGILTPFHFLEVAEEAGLIKYIDKWVLEEACRETQSWRKEGFDDLIVSVNVSKQFFESDEFENIVLNTLEKTELPPQLLSLEISENINILNIKSSFQKLERLREAGILISLDDFGTGYSSMAQLKRFPIDVLKIDQSFVRYSNGKDEDAAIVRLILNMAKVLGFEVVCEGIETEEQQEFLKNEGCDYAQGYYYSKPVTGEKCREMLMEKIG